MSKKRIDVQRSERVFLEKSMEPKCLENECRFIWKIENSHCKSGSYDTSTYYESPLFSSSSGRKCQIAMQLSKNNDCLVNSYSCDSAAIWRVDIVFKDQRDLFQTIDLAENCTYNVSYSKSNDQKVCVDLLLKMKKEMRSPPIYFGVSSAYKSVKEIKLTMFTSTTTVDNEYHGSSAREKITYFEYYGSSAREKMLTYFGELYENDLHSDVKIKVDNKIFPAHKAILAAHSEVFEAMFRSDMIEKESGVITIKDLEPDTVGTLLQFLYTHKDPALLTFEGAENLYRAAHKYQIADLLKISRQYLVKLVNEDHILNMLILASKFCDRVLKDASMLFFSNHPDYSPNIEESRAVILEYPDIFPMMLGNLKSLKNSK